VSRLGDPIRIVCSFESLHADSDGEVTLKLKLPASETAKAGLFPLMRDIAFDAVFTPNAALSKGLDTV